ncbi:hypothetical protein BGZ57DRAFT_926960 [Hyaloscypha finlandica]|nr:hypothetical protein BGZ57DRAFT_926960 [Hyaloscypha finlandica]
MNYQNYIDSPGCGLRKSNIPPLNTGNNATIPPPRSSRPKAKTSDFRLQYMLGLRQGNHGRKKRMDRKWWNDIQQVPIFDPEPQESDWKLLFGMNTKNQFHPDLSWADSQWSVTQKTTGNFVAVFTAEGKLLEMRKNIGQPFLGPDNLPLAIQGIVMCGNRPEWKDKVGAWSIEDYHLAQNRDEWADRILNPGKAAETPKSPPQEIEESLGINVLPGEISSAAEKDNRKLRKRLQQTVGREWTEA